MRRYSKRDKVSDLLRHAISNALLTELEDERLKWLSVTEVRLSGDLAHGRVFYSILPGTSSREEAEEALEENMGSLRRYLGRNLRLKRLPALTFTYDETLDRAERIESLLRTAKEGGDDGSPPDSDDAG